MSEICLRRRDDGRGKCSFSFLLLMGSVSILSKLGHPDSRVVRKELSRMLKFRFRLRDRTFNERFDARSPFRPAFPNFVLVGRERIPLSAAAVRLGTMRKVSRNSHCSTRSEHLTDWSRSSCRPPVERIDGVISGLRKRSMPEKTIIELERMGYPYGVCVGIHKSSVVRWACRSEAALVGQVSTSL